MSITAEDVKAEAKRWGARIVGVGSVDRWMNAPKGHKPRDFLPKAESVIVFGIPQFKAMAKWRNFMKGSDMYPEEKVEGFPNRFTAESAGERATPAYRTWRFSRGAILIGAMAERMRAGRGSSRLMTRPHTRLSAGRGLLRNSRLVPELLLYEYRCTETGRHQAVVSKRRPADPGQAVLLQNGCVIQATIRWEVKEEDSQG